MTRDELRSVLPGGKHHDVAMKWVADDAAVLQCAHIDGDIWQSVTKPPPSYVEPFCVDRKWRIKPQVLRYRVALFKQFSRVYINHTDDERVANSWQKHIEFVRWLGDWQEIEL